MTIPHEQQILNLLQSQQDRTQGDLLEQTDCQTYAELNTALQDLQRQDLIEFHFPDGILRYRLKPPAVPERERAKFFWQPPK